MLDKPAIIKRPILVSSDKRFMVGFNANDYLDFSGSLIFYVLPRY